jgi:hypothetical protein
LIPYSDGIPARRFPVVNVTLIVLNFAVFGFIFGVLVALALTRTGRIESRPAR